MIRKIVPLAFVSTIAIISGCGGGGGAGSGSVQSVQVSGVVADGYLVNATVFLDKNGNCQQDPG